MKEKPPELVREIRWPGCSKTDRELIWNCGKFITNSDRVFVNPQMRPVFHLSEEEYIYSATRELKEQRTPKAMLSNISESDMMRWSRKDELLEKGHCLKCC